MHRVVAALVLGGLVAGCGALRSRGDEPLPPVRSADDRPLEFRQPALFIAVSADPGANVDSRSRQNLPADYEGALLEALNARAIIVRDVAIIEATRRIDSRAAAARAQEVGADAAIVIKVRLATEIVRVCEETRRPLRGSALVVHQDVEVVRASDAATRLRIVDSPALSANDVEIDCDAPREARRGGVRAAMDAAVAKLAKRLFGA